MGELAPRSLHTIDGLAVRLSHNHSVPLLGRLLIEMLKATNFAPQLGTLAYVLSRFFQTSIFKGVLRANSGCVMPRYTIIRWQQSFRGPGKDHPSARTCSSSKARFRLMMDG